MSENKSKLPDLNEITHAATKLFKDIGRSAKEIYQDYKNKRESTVEEAPKEKKSKTTATAAKKTKKAADKDDSKK